MEKQLSTRIKPQILGADHKVDVVTTIPVLLQNLQDEDENLSKVRTWSGNNKRPKIMGNQT
jgi:hypothetical protein